jgi:uncharacterized protein (TIGR03000 family)
MSRQRFLTAGAACVFGVLAVTGVSRAQVTAPEPGQATGFTAGSPYSFRPLDPAWSFYAVPPPSPRYDRLGNQAIFMTSINYPGVYGAYTFGVTPTSYYDRAAYFTPDAGPGGFTLEAARRPLTEGLGTALINVKVPRADALLTFDNQATSPTGTDREFVTPLLRPGTNYVYNVRTTWVDGDVQRTRDKNVYVRAGDTLVVDLTTGRGTYEGPSLRVQPRPEAGPALRTEPLPEPGSTLRTQPPPRPPNGAPR